MRGWKTSGRASFMPGHDIHMHAIEVSETGGPEVLRYVDSRNPSPANGELLIKAEAIGVNFIDTYFRSGQYPRPLPFVLGSEVCGAVAAIGEAVAVSAWATAWSAPPRTAAYAEFGTAPAFLTARCRTA